MDPLTLLTNALVAGLSNVAKDAVKDSYNALKQYLQRKISNNNGAQEALKSLEKNPASEARQAVVKEELGDAGLANDAELIALARSILERADPAGASLGKYNVTVTGGQVGAIGDKAQVSMGREKE
jgi:hypothetical protein